MKTKTFIIQEFDYRPHRGKMLGMFMLCWAGFCIFGYLAFYVEGGANVRGFDLTEQQLRWVFRILLLISPIGLYSIGAQTYTSFFEDWRVALTNNSIILPRSNRVAVPVEEIEIPYAEISKIDVLSLTRSCKVLQIFHFDEVVSLQSYMFPSKELFTQMSDSAIAAYSEFQVLHSG